MLSVPHLAILFLIALLVFGPEKLPELARMLGKAMAEFRRVTYDVRRVVEDEMRDMERQAREADQRKHEAPPAPPAENPILPPSLAESSDEQSSSEQPPAGTVPTDPPTGVKAEEVAISTVPDSEDFENPKNAGHS